MKFYGVFYKLLLGVYEPFVAIRRNEFWAELESIRSSWARPWVVGGDFNTIRFVHEKKPQRNIMRSMKNFNALINKL